MDELQLLKDRHDALPDPTPEGIAQARARLTAHIQASHSARVPRTARRARAGWALSLVGAAAALVMVLATTANGPDSPLPRAEKSSGMRAVAGPDDLAHNAALVAASEPSFGPTRWAYLKTVFAQTQEGGGKPLFGKPGKTRTQEMWRRTDDKQFALVQGGKLKVVNGSKTIPDPSNPMDYPYLLSLPSRPVELLARVYKVVDAQQSRQVTAVKGKPAGSTTPRPLTAEERDARAFELITLYMRNAVLPRKVQAALYGAMAKIPGVGYRPTANDLAGRPGVTLYRMEDGYLHSEIIIDPQTYAYLGFHIVAIKDHLPVKKGQIIGWGALAKGVFVDKPGRRG